MIIVVAQQKGGVGKSTLAAHLAVAAAMRNDKENVMLIDIDPQASLDAWYAARLASQKRRTTELAKLEFQKLSGWQLESELRRKAKDFQWVIVDTPPHADTDSRTAIRLADLVILPIQPSPLDLWAAQSTLQIITKQARQSLVVMNRVNARASLLQKLEAELQATGFRLASTKLGNRSGFADAMGRGLTVMETAPKGKAAQELLALGDEVFA